MSTRDQNLELTRQKIRKTALVETLRKFGVVIDPEAVALEISADSKMLQLANRSLLHTLEIKNRVESMN